MTDFNTKEWADLCERLRQSAALCSKDNEEAKAEIQKECDEFCERQSPQAYDEVLIRNKEARDLVVGWREKAAA